MEKYELLDVTLFRYSDTKKYESIIYHLDNKFADLLEGTDALIFGGYIRDLIIDNKNIKNIDIIGLKDSIDIIKNRLFARKYTAKATENRYDNGFFNMTNMTKQNRIPIQLIRLVNLQDFKKINDLSIHDSKHTPESTDNLKFHFHNYLIYIATQVDLSTSGLVYNPSLELKESVKDAFNDNINKWYRVMTDSVLYNKDRTEKRIEKLKKLGFNELLPKNDIAFDYSELFKNNKE